jgi:Protein of unknown function (DUF3108)
MNHLVNHRTISIIIFTMVMLILLSFHRTTKTVVKDECSISNSVFQHGEKLEYKLYYNWGLIWIPAGEVIFTVKESDHTYEMKAVGKTYKSYENIFKVNDYFYSKVDKKTLFPKNFVRIVEEGNYRLYDSISFDQARNIAVSYHGKTKESAKPQIHAVNQCMQDMVSNIYYMRNFQTDDMNKGDKFAVKMFFDKEVFPINVRYDGKEKKDIKELGKFNTIRIIPDLVEGNVFKKGDHMKLWVSDDKNKIPLLIESPVSVGSIKAVLKSHSGLRYTLDSKIKE